MTRVAWFDPHYIDARGALSTGMDTRIIAVDDVEFLLHREFRGAGFGFTAEQCEGSATLFAHHAEVLTHICSYNVWYSLERLNNKEHNEQLPQT